MRCSDCIHLEVCKYPDDDGCKMFMKERPSGMSREEAIMRLEFKVRYYCPEADSNIGDCDKCERYPCVEMEALKTLIGDDNK